MLVTHFGHACVLVETEVSRILLDPGTMSTGYEDLTDLDAVIVTHQHADHLDLSRIGALLMLNPRAELLVDDGSALLLSREGINCRVVQRGDRMDVGAATVELVGGEHAVIHPDIANIANLGVVLDDGAFYHPGDSYFVPEPDIDVLGVPSSGAWVKVEEAVDFIRAVTPRVAIPIHEAVLASTGTQYALLDNLSPNGTSFRPLPRATATAT